MELERISLTGMRHAVENETILLKESHDYPEYANQMRTAKMILHVSPTENAWMKAKELMDTLFTAINTYNKHIAKEEFDYRDIHILEEEECYPEIMFENISDAAVNALGHIADAISAKYKKDKWFELIMIENHTLERELAPAYAYPKNEEEKPKAKKPWTLPEIEEQKEPEKEPEHGLWTEPAPERFYPQM